MSDPINGNQNRRTCVILLDLQNEFAKPGGKLHDTVADSIQQNGMLEKVPKLVEIARAKGSLIIHSPGKFIYYISYVYDKLYVYISLNSKLVHIFNVFFPSFICLFFFTTTE